MDQLMKNLLAKNPHYVRCIKPNDQKLSMTFDKDLCLHQVRYLGLLENVRVKRAGFCYRQKYEKFLERYKMLAPETWPNFGGQPKDGCQKIMEAQEIVKEEYQLGKTKIFIRNPLTLFQLEEDRNKSKHRLVTSIKSNYLPHYYSTRYEKLREAATLIETVFRSFNLQKKYEEMRESATEIAKVGKGMIARKQYEVMKKTLPKYAAPIIQRNVRIHLHRVFVRKIAASAKKAGNQWRKVEWPSCSSFRADSSDILKAFYIKYRAKKYRKALTADRKLFLEEKAFAHDTFSKKKEAYPETLTQKFKGDQIGAAQNPQFTKAHPEEKVILAFHAQKVNRSDYKQVERSIIVTHQSIVTLEKGKPKNHIPFASLTGLSASTKKDLVVIIHADNEKKGDLWFVLPDAATLVEFFVRTYRVVEKESKKKLSLKLTDSLNSNNGKGNTPLKFEMEPVLELAFKKDGKDGVICSIPNGAAPPEGK